MDATLTRDASGAWTFTRMGTELFDFSAAGRLTALRDLSGNTVSLDYASDELSTITDPAGRMLTLTWVAGRVVKVTAPPAVLCWPRVDRRWSWRRPTAMTQPAI